MFDHFGSTIDVVGFNSRGELEGVANGSSVEYVREAIREAIQDRGLRNVQLRVGARIEYRLTLPQDRAILRDRYGIDVREIEAVAS